MGAAARLRLSLRSIQIIQLDSVARAVARGGTLGKCERSLSAHWCLVSDSLLVFYRNKNLFSVGAAARLRLSLRSIQIIQLDSVARAVARGGTLGKCERSLSAHWCLVCDSLLVFYRNKNLFSAGAAARLRLSLRSILMIQLDSVARAVARGGTLGKCERSLSAHWCLVCDSLLVFYRNKTLFSAGAAARLRLSLRSIQIIQLDSVARAVARGGTLGTCERSLSAHWCLVCDSLLVFYRNKTLFSAGAAARLRLSLRSIQMIQLDSVARAVARGGTLGKCERSLSAHWCLVCDSLLVFYRNKNLFSAGAAARLRLSLRSILIIQLDSVARAVARGGTLGKCERSLSAHWCLVCDSLLVFYRNKTLFSAGAAARLRLSLRSIQIIQLDSVARAVARGGTLGKCERSLSAHWCLVCDSLLVFYRNKNLFSAGAAARLRLSLRSILIIQLDSVARAVARGGTLGKCERSLSAHWCLVCDSLLVFPLRGGVHSENVNDLSPRTGVWSVTLCWCFIETKL